MEIVTADGEKVLASREQHADLFWAARGAGPGFFGVVIAFHLKLYPLPASILGSTYCFPLSQAGAVGDWISELAPTLRPSVELTLFLLQAPPPLQAGASADGGVVLMVSAVAFADSDDDGRHQLTLQIRSGQGIIAATSNPLTRLLHLVVVPHNSSSLD
jgi:FAD/FMN-containing dehydrogenase